MLTRAQQNGGSDKNLLSDELNCFCGMVDRRKTFSLISSRDHCQRSSPSRICAGAITTTPRRQTRGLGNINVLSTHAEQKYQYLHLSYLTTVIYISQISPVTTKTIATIFEFVAVPCKIPSHSISVINK